MNDMATEVCIFCEGRICGFGEQFVFSGIPTVYLPTHFTL